MTKKVMKYLDKYLDCTVSVMPFFLIGVVFAYLIGLMVVLYGENTYAVTEQQALTQCTVSQVTSVEFTRPRFGNGREVQRIDLKCPGRLYEHLVFERDGNWILEYPFPRHAWNAIQIGNPIICGSEKITIPKWLYTLESVLSSFFKRPPSYPANPRFQYHNCKPE